MKKNENESKSNIKNKIFYIFADKSVTIGAEALRARIWKLNEMDADHVSAWSKGGSTDISNCQMLCKTHNRAKGNR